MPPLLHVIGTWHWINSAVHRAITRLIYQNITVVCIVGYLNTNSEVEDFLEDYRKMTGTFFAVSHNRSRDTDKSGHFKGTGNLNFYHCNANLEFRLPVFITEATYNILIFYKYIIYEAFRI